MATDSANSERERLDLAQFEGHTPGPWEWQIGKQDRGIGNGAAIRRALNAPRASCPNHPYARDQVVGPNYTMAEGDVWEAWINVGAADARLIASAPHLLAELTSLRSSLSRKDEEIEGLRDVYEAARKYFRNEAEPVSVCNTNLNVLRNAIEVVKEFDSGYGRAAQAEGRQE